MSRSGITANKPLGRIKDFTLDDLLDTDSLEEIQGDVCNFSIDSPLNPLSPNLSNFWEGLNEARKPSGVVGISAQRQLPGIEEDKDVIAPLPMFTRKKIDPRRQSTAIFSAFEESTFGDGLLGDGELAVAPTGDDDILIPLAKSCKITATKGNSTLWVDPDTDDILENLPEPELDNLQPVLGGGAKQAVGIPTGDRETQPREQNTSGTSSHKPMGIRDSIAVFDGFSKACDRPGLDDEDGDGSLLLTAFQEAPTPAEAACDPKVSTMSSQVIVSTEKKKVTHAPRLRPSRLKPPSSSTSFFSDSAAGMNNREVVPGSKERVPGIPSNPSIPPKPLVGVNSSQSKVTSSAPPRAPIEAHASRCRTARPSRLPIPGLKGSVLHAQPRKKPETLKTHSADPVKPRVEKPDALTDPVPVPQTAAAPTIQNEISTTPGVNGTDTPRSARLRWLEEHPELAFGGGAKIANSPGAMEEEPRRKTAVDMHYEAWGTDLTAL